MVRDSWCTPYLLALQLTVENSIITTYVKTSAVVLNKWYGTVTAYNESQSWMALHLDETNRTLSWSNTQAPANNLWTEQSEGFTIVQEVLQGLGIFCHCRCYHPDRPPYSWWARCLEHCRHSQKSWVEVQWAIRGGRMRSWNVQARVASTSSSMAGMLAPVPKVKG